MTPRVLWHTIGSIFAIGGLLAAVGQGIWLTRQRWLQWQQPPRKVIAQAPPQPSPQPLPPDFQVFVVCYHDFQPEPKRKWVISPQRLEAQLQMLKALGFTFLTMSEAADLLQGRWQGPIPLRAVVITVDDGFVSAYTVLFPLLRRYKAKATLFVYTDWIGKGQGALTWEQLRTMVSSGLVEVASHTVTHPYPRGLRKRLPYERYRDRMLWEFRQSKAVLEQRLGIRVAGLAYPGGYADETLRALAQRAGYRWAVVINPKPMSIAVDRYAIPRYGISSATTVIALRDWVTQQPVQLVRHDQPQKQAKSFLGNARHPNAVLPAKGRSSLP